MVMLSLTFKIVFIMIKITSRFWCRYRHLRSAGHRYHGRYDKMRQNGQYLLVCNNFSGCPTYLNFAI